MSIRSTAGFAALALAAALALSQSAGTAAAGPFSGMAGSWSGGGLVSLASGSRERLRCRASNSVDSGGDNINLSIRCASDSYKIDLSGYIKNSNGSLSGQWSETNYNSAGSLTGRASGNHINAHAVGNTFSALISMSGTGSQMSVSIRPQATDVRQVSLSFRKR
jgi:hypothetical protein